MTRLGMRANVKPFVHWAIYKSFHVRYTNRESTYVEGILIAPSGERPFRYDALSREIHLSDAVITVDEHGWELAARPFPPDTAGLDST